MYNFLNQDEGIYRNKLLQLTQKISEMNEPAINTFWLVVAILIWKKSTLPLNLWTEFEKHHQL